MGAVDVDHAFRTDLEWPFWTEGRLLAGALVVFLIAGVLETVEAADSPSHVSSGRFSSEPIQPIPSQPIQPAEIVSLGRKLFENPRLSTDNSVSCASCYPLNKAGVDGLQFSPGVNGAVGTVNTSTVLNCGFNFVQFWDGRAASLEE